MKNIERNIEIKILVIIFSCLLAISCNKDDTATHDGSEITVVSEVELTKRPGTPPETTTSIPHIQIGVEPVAEINEELSQRVYSLPGVEKCPSVVGGWQGIWLTKEMSVAEPDALIGGREFAHIHDDGSLHIFLKPSRSHEVVKTCWGIYHPYALQHPDPWYGFVMLYTPQSYEELDVTFQLIVDGYNYVTGQNLIATDFY